MFGYGSAELAIIGVILVIIVAVIAGLVVLAVSIARRRGVSAHPERTDESRAPSYERRS